MISKNLSMMVVLVLLGCATTPQEPLLPETRTISQPIDLVRELVVARTHARGYLPVEGQDLTFDQVASPSRDPILGIFPGKMGGVNNRARFALMQIDSKTTKVFLDPLLVISPNSNSPMVVPLANAHPDRVKFRTMLDDIEREAASLPPP